MPRWVVLASACAIVSGCAFPGTVQRIGVDYNTAVAGMANELALLNILRAKEDLPLHFTSVGRLSGSVIVRGSASLNTALRADQTTRTNQTVTTTSASPSTAVTVANQVLEGVDVLTPTVGGEVSSGPSFDIAIHDGQRFYQGVLTAIPFTTIENYINQGISNQLLMRLLVERIDFRGVTPEGSDGPVLFSWRNAAAGRDAIQFAGNIACYELLGRPYRAEPTDLMAVSRLRRSDSGNLVGLTMQELALLDGRSLSLSRPIAAPAGDEGVMIRRVSEERRVADLRLKPECRDAQGRVPRPTTPPRNPVYLENHQAIVLGADQRSDAVVPVRPQIIFRSTESVIRFLGRYLHARETAPSTAPAVEGVPLFSVVEGRAPNALVRTSLLGRRYSIADDTYRRQNMQILGLVQQLINLHKDSSERPTTVPVQVIPGS